MTSLSHRENNSPQDINAYLREIAAVASEAAITSNPKVRKESIRLLIKQLEQLRAMCTEEVRQH
jgi:hypothetical protein